MALSPESVMKLAVTALDDKKAQDIKILHTHDQTVLADYFIIATANSTTHVKTLADEVTKVLKENGEPARAAEGYRSGGWVLVDFGCVITHIFLKDLREFYNLERLWSDAPDIDINTIINNGGTTAVRESAEYE